MKSISIILTTALAAITIATPIAEKTTRAAISAGPSAEDLAAITQALGARTAGAGVLSLHKRDGDGCGQCANGRRTCWIYDGHGFYYYYLQDC